MAPHERVMMLWLDLLVLLLFVSLCSGQSHTKFVRGSFSNKNLEPEILRKREDHHTKVVNPGGNHLYVSKTGNANFNRIQAAIDSIPEYNEQWVQIDIAAGLYQ